MYGNTRIQGPIHRKTSSFKKIPLRFLCDLAYAVLDNTTGDLLEYRHLMKHPKYKYLWTKSFGTERYAASPQAQKPSSLFKKKTYHVTERAMRLMQESYACFAMAIRINTEHESQWVKPC
jgi:hypothetical protein